MQIPSRCMEEQKHIVDELNCIVKIKEQRQQELQLLDNLIKFELNKIAARWPAKAMAQFFFTL